MITPEEEEQLALLEAREQDFYAGAMFLGLTRTERYMTEQRMLSKPVSPAAVAEIVVGVFTDLNERAARSDVV